MVVRNWIFKKSQTQKSLINHHKIIMFIGHGKILQNSQTYQLITLDETIKIVQSLLSLFMPFNALHCGFRVTFLPIHFLSGVPKRNKVLSLFARPTQYYTIFQSP
jgi:hypothetical protein